MRMTRMRISDEYRFDILRFSIALILGQDEGFRQTWGGSDPMGTVPSFVLKWRTQKDSNPRPAD